MGSWPFIKYWNMDGSMKNDVYFNEIQWRIAVPCFHWYAARLPSYAAHIAPS